MSFFRRLCVVSVGVATGMAAAPYFSGGVRDGRLSHVLPADTPSSPFQWLTPTVNALRTVPADSLPQEKEKLRSDRDVSAIQELVGAFMGGVAHLLHRAAGLTATRTAYAASPIADGTGSTDEAVTSAATQATTSSTDLKTASHKLKSRFLRYAQRDAETGEYSLSLDGFVRCMLLLPEASTEALVDVDDFASLEEPSTEMLTSKSTSSEVSTRNPRVSSTWLQRMPAAVRRRFVSFFRSVDLDDTNSIGYAEFVVLFTFLSTPRATLERAFRVFDLDDNKRLSEAEFCRLLNTIMVDPAVQVRYTPEEIAQEAVTPSTGKAAKPPVTSLAAASRQSERERRRHRHDLSFELASSLMRPLLYGPLPLHVGAPPGSTHYKDGGIPTTNAFLSSSSPDAPRLFGSVSLFAGPSRMQRLQEVAQEDALLHAVSYPTFLYRVDYLRWELRAIEFGLCDPDNKGFITLDSCRRLLHPGHGCLTATGGEAPHHTQTTNRIEGSTDTANTDAAVSTLKASGSAPVTWQVYQTLFDIIKDADTILPALRLLLDSLPPVPALMLHGGAIPDAAVPPATEAIQSLVQQTVRQYNEESQKKGNVTTAAAAVDRAGEGSASEGSQYDAAAFGVAKDASQSPSEMRVTALRAQGALVRPTALTWNQFYQVLAVLGSAPPLSHADKTLLRALLDEDDSDSLSLDEFAQLCAMKQSFFAESLPRFDEPPRNTVQQFFFCMQQLQ